MTSATIHTFRDLLVWQRAMQMVEEIYKITGSFPKEETLGLTNQMRRAAVSIPSHIAEGKRRGTKKEFAQFLRYAFGSTAELDTQMEIAKGLHANTVTDFKKAEALLLEVIKMLSVMTRKEKTASKKKK